MKYLPEGKCEIMPFGHCEIWCLASSEMKSTHRRSDFTRQRRISHCEAVFHPPEGWISLKKARFRVLFSWRRVRDSLAFSFHGSEKRINEFASVCTGS